MVKQESVAVKEEGSEGAPGPVDNTLAQSAADMRRAADILSTTLPQVVSALSALAQSTAEMRRDAETTSTGLAAVLTEMKQQLTTVASAQLQTATALTDISARLTGMERSMASLVTAADTSGNRLASLATTAASNNIRLDQVVAAVKSQEERSLVATLQRAAADVQLNSFFFHVLGSAERRSSEVLVRDILFKFNRGGAVFISDQVYVSKQRVAGLPTEEQRQAFRDALVNQVHELTGHRPQLYQTRNGEGQMQWAIRRV